MMHFQDPLSQFIRHLSPQVEVFAQVGLREPWGMAETQLDCGAFSYLRSGRCVVEVEGQAPIHLRAGQLILLPYGCAHRIMSEPGVPCLSVSELFDHQTPEAIRQMNIGGDGAPCQLMCGNIRFSMVQHWGQDPKIGGMPNTIVVDIDPGDRLENYLTWIYQENRERDAGHDLAMKHLLELFFLEMLRGLNTLAINPSWLRALHDRHLATAILAIQDNFAREWTVEELASLAALSRSSFAERFKRVAGTAPLQFLRQWRCFVAAERLVTTSDSVQQIAQYCGFQSSDVLIRNFKQFHQTTPKQYRLNAHVGEAEKSTIHPALSMISR